MFLLDFAPSNRCPCSSSAPELDPVLGLKVASEPELKPVPVLELELGFV